MEVKRESGSSLVISEDVIAKIASVAATDIPGVAGVVPKPVDLKRLIKRDDAAKAVFVDADESKTVIDIYLSLKTGARISEVAEKVQHNIKEAVQNMTGRVVTRVNVHIQAIELEEKTAE